LTLLAAYGSCASAQARYDFFLDPDLGNGFFRVNDASIPEVGQITVAATDFEGTFFGYSRGNTFTTIDQEGERTMVLPHESASVTFQDGAATAIHYQEVHSVLAFGRTEDTSSSLFLQGSTWVLQRGRGGFSEGTIRILPAVPEPATIVLLFGGLIVIGAMIRARRRDVLCAPKASPARAEP
jgi:hypothetical protein